MTPKNVLRQLVEQAARNATDDDGRFTAKAHVEELLRLLDGNPLPTVTELTREEAARGLVMKFAREHNPRRRTREETAIPELYDDCFVLVLNDGTRVWMRDATYGDLIEYRNRKSEKNARAQQVQRELDSYVDSRLVLWRGRGDIKRLGHLERELCGYSPTLIPAGDPDYEDP